MVFSQRQYLNNSCPREMKIGKADSEMSNRTLCGKYTTCGHSHTHEPTSLQVFSVSNWKPEVEVPS